MRKSRILTFLFGLWPGAGQMYLGYMKRGISLFCFRCFRCSGTWYLCFYPSGHLVLRIL